MQSNDDKPQPVLADLQDYPALAIAKVLSKLELRLYTIVAYHGYDTGYPAVGVLCSINQRDLDKALAGNEESILDRDNRPAYYELLDKLIQEAANCCGLRPDNKTAAHLLLDTNEIVYVCAYDSVRAITTAITPRSGSVYHPTNANSNNSRQ